MEYPDHINELIACALAGEASTSQLQELELWKGAAAGNLEYFRSMEKIMQAASSLKPMQEYDTNQAWAKLKQSMEPGTEGGNIRYIKPRQLSSVFLRMAAMLLLVAGVGFAIYKVMNVEKTTEVVVESGTEIREFALPDSTGIVLNRNSQITWAFSNKKRTVALKGEAFFNLAPDPERPFEVKANGVIIRDIGTSFNVKSVEGNDSMTVRVTDGEIMMSSPNGQSLVLKKGETGIYLKSRDEFIRQAVSDTNAISYRTKIFVFENATLSMVTEKISEVYGINLLAVPAVAECHLTVTFKNENPDAIIDIIASTLQLTVKRENNTIILDGTDCGQ